MLTQALPRPVAADSIVLADGHHFTVRPVTPASKPLIAAAMDSGDRRVPADATTAEIAITVVDAWQGRGIGKALIAQLTAAAAARGIRTLQAIVLPDNATIIGLLQRHAPWARWRRDGDDLMAVIPLPAEPVVVAAYR
jgi:GNAT superfamily N-acetyltransferase